MMLQPTGSAKKGNNQSQEIKILHLGKLVSQRMVAPLQPQRKKSTCGLDGDCLANR